MGKLAGMIMAVAVMATACADVYGPADVTLEFRLTETAEGSSATTTESIFGFVDSMHNFMDIFAYRLVDSEDASKEPVGTIIRNGQKIQPMPGILIEITMHYILIEDCTTSPFLLSETNYFELVQIGVKQTTKGCSPPLTSSEQVGEARPSCILFDGPEDNGNSMLVRTGPHGTIQFDVIPRLSDPIQGAVFEIQARSGGGAAGFSLPDDVEDACFATPSTTSPTGGASPRTGPSFFSRPFLR